MNLVYMTSSTVWPDYIAEISLLPPPCPNLSVYCINPTFAHVLSIINIFIISHPPSPPPPPLDNAFILRLLFPRIDRYNQLLNQPIDSPQYLRFVGMH